MGIGHIKQEIVWELPILSKWSITLTINVDIMKFLISVSISSSRDYMISVSISISNLKCDLAHAYARTRVMVVNIKFVGTTAVDAGDIYIPDFGVRMVGPVKVSAPTSAATVAVYYG